MLVCLFASLILHGLVLLGWALSGQAGGSAGAGLRASLQPPAEREQQPVQADAVPDAVQPTQAGNDAVPAPDRPPAGPPQAPLRAEDYVSVEAVDQRPHFLVDMHDYVPASLDPDEHGRIVLQLLVGADGEVDGVVVESSELTPRGTRRFVQRLNALRLEPARHKGVAVRARWRLEFTFEPQI